MNTILISLKKYINKKTQIRAVFYAGVFTSREPDQIASKSWPPVSHTQPYTMKEEFINTISGIARNLPLFKPDLDQLMQDHC